jgi:homoserine O-acetyltransferase
MVDPNWNGGDYYGGKPPLAGLAKALTAVTLQANHAEWTNGTFGRRPAKEGEDPARSLAARFQVQSVLDNAGEARAKVSDANHLLYLVKANQLFVAGGASLEDAARRIKAPVLMISQPKDLVFPPAMIERTARVLAAGGVDVRQHHIQGSRGHLDGVASMKQAEEVIRRFLAE